MSFFTVFLSVYALLNGYLAWRLATLPLVSALLPAKAAVSVVILLASLFPLSWKLRDVPVVGTIAEVVGTTWLGMFLLLITGLLLVELATLGGWVFSGYASYLRQGAVGIAMALSVFAIIQAHRTPAVIEHSVTLAQLPAARDGFRLAVLSDLHLGNRIGGDWLEKRIQEVAALKPDAIVLVGDIVDRDVSAVEPLAPILAKFSAPQGVYAVIGNHEYYAGDRGSTTLLQNAGIRVLRNENVAPLPGLVISGVDDLTVAGRDGRAAEPLLTQALSNPPPGAVVLLSHTPTALDVAAQLGAHLMLSGHTHDGQIWPFRYLVKTRYPHTYGFLQVGQMQSFVTRGVGTWGPRMRLWARGEIVLLTLRSPGKP